MPPRWPSGKDWRLALSKAGWNREGSGILNKKGETTLKKKEYILEVLIISNIKCITKSKMWEVLVE